MLGRGGSCRGWRGDSLRDGCRLHDGEARSRDPRPLSGRYRPSRGGRIGDKAARARGFPTAVYDDTELLDEDLKSLRHQLEFIPPGHSMHRTPSDQFGFVIQRTTRPPYYPPELWQALEYGARKEAAKMHELEKPQLAPKRDRCATLHATTDAYRAQGGYKEADEVVVIEFRGFRCAAPL